MKRFLIPFATLSILGAGSPALGAATVELTVKGLLSPTACTPLLSSNGLIDYGKISQADLNLDRGTRLPIRYLDVTVDCNGNSRFALRMRDNRDGTANVNSEIFYGLGLDKSGNKIGLYFLSFDPTQTQAIPLAEVYGTESTTGGLAWRSANSNPIDIGARSYLGFTDQAGGTAGPAAIKFLNSRVKVETVIAAKQNLDLSSEIDMDGSSTLEVIYL